MYVKKVKRICGVRGCKNTHNVYALSKSREMGNSVIMCRDCMKDAFDSTENYVEPRPPRRETRPRFYHPELAVAVPSVAEVEPEPVEVIENVTEDIPISVAEDTVTPKAEDKPKTPTKKPNTKKKK